MSAKQSITTLHFVTITLFSCFPKLPEPDGASRPDVAAGADGDDVAALPDGAVNLTDLDVSIEVLPNSVVRLRWTGVLDAVEFLVLRDDVEVARLLPTTTTFDDQEVPSLNTQMWSAPTGFSASTYSSSDVRLSWQAPPRPLPLTLTYQVKALSNDTVLRASPIMTASIPPLDVQAFEIEARTETGTRLLLASESVRSFIDKDAPVAKLSVDTVRASDGEYANYIKLSASAAVPVETDVHYRIRVVFENLDKGLFSNEVIGYRSSDLPYYQWQRVIRGATSLVFTDIADANQLEYLDRNAPQIGEPFHYRLRVTAATSQPFESDIIEGRRLAFRRLSAGSSETCGVSTAGHVWCWGFLSGLQSDTPVLTPTKIPGLEGIIDVQTGGGSPCARNRALDVFCWGGLGLRDPFSRTEEFLPSMFGATELGVGYGFACGVDVAGFVRCWGANYARQLANGTTDDADTPTTVLTGEGQPLNNVTNVSVGGQHACALRTEGDVWCWGYFGPYYNGALGIGNAVANGFASRVAGEHRFQSVSAGYDHTCGKTTRGGIACWGDNSRHQTGAQSEDIALSPVIIEHAFLPGFSIISGGYSTCVIEPPGGIVTCWGEIGSTIRQLSPALPSVFMNATAVTVGNRFICALENGTLESWCWGANEMGELGDGFQYGSSSEPIPVALPGAD